MEIITLNRYDEIRGAIGPSGTYGDWPVEVKCLNCESVLSVDVDDCKQYRLLPHSFVWLVQCQVCKWEFLLQGH